MSWITASLRRRARRALKSDDGFTIIELVIACGVLAMVFSSLAYLGTIAFTDAALAKNRQAATALVNQAIEQVRALPYDTVALGLQTNDVAAGSDPSITLSGGAYRYGGERIPNGDNATVPPLVPHRATTTVGSADYTVAVYVTYLDDDPTTGTFRVTARASWVSTLRDGVQKFVEAQTVVAPCTSGDGSGAIHPFCAPNQAFLYANSETSEGGITIAPNNGIGISGTPLGLAGLWIPLESTNMQLEQIEAVAATARTSGVTLTESGQSEQTAGRNNVSVGADSDPTQSKPVYETASSGTVQNASTLSLGSGGYGISVTSSANDTASATATVLATVTNLCESAASPPVPQLDSLPCGSAAARQAGSMDAELDLGVLGDLTVASIASPTIGGRAHTNRDAVAQPATCPQTSGDGCIHASHSHAIGDVRIGAYPSALELLAPAGFAGYVVGIDDAVRTVSAEAGVGSANPTATTSGTVRFWQGGAYQTVNLASAGSVSIPVSFAVGSMVTTGLTISGTLRTGAVSAPACAAPCASATAEAESPLIGDLRIHVVVNGTTVVDVLLHIDFGTLMAHAEYTPSV